ELHQARLAGALRAEQHRKDGHAQAGEPDRQQPERPRPDLRVRKDRLDEGVPGRGFDLRVRYVRRAVQVRGRRVDVVRAHRLIEGLTDIPGDAAGRPDDLRVGVQVRQPQRHVRLFAGDSLELLGDPATTRGAGEQAATVR